MFADLSLFESLSNGSSGVSVFNAGGKSVVIRRRIVRNGSGFVADKVRRRPEGLQADQSKLYSDQRGDTYRSYYRSLKNKPSQEVYTTLRWLYSVGEYALADRLAQKLASSGVDFSAPQVQQAPPAQSSAPKSRGFIRRFFGRK